MAGWRRAAAVLALFASGWVARDLSGGVAPPAIAQSIVDEASASHSAALARRRMASRDATEPLDADEIRRTTGIALPALPANWRISDVEVVPAGRSVAVAVMIRTERGELASLFATRAETPAERLPLVERRQARAVAFWEVGPFAYAVTGDLAPARVLSLAAAVARG